MIHAWTTREPRVVHAWITHGSRVNHAWFTRESRIKRSHLAVLYCIQCIVIFVSSVWDIRALRYLSYPEHPFFWIWWSTPQRFLRSQTWRFCDLEQWCTFDGTDTDRDNPPALFKRTGDILACRQDYLSVLHGTTNLTWLSKHGVIMVNCLTQEHNTSWLRVGAFIHCATFMLRKVHRAEFWIYSTMHPKSDQWSRFSSRLKLVHFQEHGPLVLNSNLIKIAYIFLNPDPSQMILRNWINILSYIYCFSPFSL